MRRPLLLSGGPQFRVRESKPGLITFRKEGGPGTIKTGSVTVRCGIPFLLFLIDSSF